MYKSSSKFSVLALCDHVGWTLWLKVLTCDAPPVHRCWTIFIVSRSSWRLQCHTYTPSVLTQTNTQMAEISLSYNRNFWSSVVSHTSKKFEVLKLKWCNSTVLSLLRACIISDNIVITRVLPVRNNRAAMVTLSFLIRSSSNNISSMLNAVTNGAWVIDLLRRAWSTGNRRVSDAILTRRRYCPAMNRAVRSDNGHARYLCETSVHHTGTLSQAAKSSSLLNDVGVNHPEWSS